MNRTPAIMRISADGVTVIRENRKISLSQANRPILRHVWRKAARLVQSLLHPVRKETR